MRTFYFSLLFLAVAMTSGARAACVHISYPEEDGSVSEIRFPVTKATAADLVALGYQEVACKKKYDVPQINQKCAKMRQWPDKMRESFVTRFKITPDTMCQYSRDYLVAGR